MLLMAALEMPLRGTHRETNRCCVSFQKARYE